MLIRNLKVSGLLSFGPKGVDLPLRDLNVLIGPNGSGKSNLLEVLALLKAAPSDLPAPVKEMGGIRQWLWKGDGSRGEAVIEAVVEAVPPNLPVRHTLAITEHGDRFELADESIETEGAYPDKPGPSSFYRFRRGHPILEDSDSPGRSLGRESLKPDQSILSQLRDPFRYPALSSLQERYEQIHFFRNWSFGPAAFLRRGQSAQGRSDSLRDGGENLALVLQNFRPALKAEFLESLKRVYEGIEAFDVQNVGGNLQLYLVEKGGREIFGTRLSDGTLRYLCLLTILLDPDPPSLIAIEEPELGLHPDIIPHLGDLLQKASQRTQLVVTTHSRMLVDSLSEEPASVIVCEKEEGATRFDRLDAVGLNSWLEEYSLGQLWSMGQLGGNRW